MIINPSRRPCADCKTIKGKLRRACPYCDKPVCNDCYPQFHSCKRTDAERLSAMLSEPGF